MLSYAVTSPKTDGRTHGAAKIYKIQTISDKKFQSMNKRRSVEAEMCSQWDGGQSQSHKVKVNYKEAGL